LCDDRHPEDGAALIGGKGDRRQRAAGHRAPTHGDEFVLLGEDGNAAHEEVLVAEQVQVEVADEVGVAEDDHATHGRLLGPGLPRAGHVTLGGDHDGHGQRSGFVDLAAEAHLAVERLRGAPVRVRPTFGTGHSQQENGDVLR
jgi:hypothetical protein